jgi:hypothetical protein
MPDKGVGGSEVVDRRFRWSQAFERVGDTVKQREKIGVGHRGVGHRWVGISGLESVRNADAITPPTSAKTREVSEHCPLPDHRVPMRAPRLLPAGAPMLPAPPDPHCPG